MKVKTADDTALDNVISVSAGYNKSAAVTSGEYLYVWGSNTYTDLGDEEGNKTYASRVVKGDSIHDDGEYLDNVTEAALGSDDTVVLRVDGTVWASGQNTVGQLGEFINYECTAMHRVGAADYYALNFNNGEITIDGATVDSTTSMGSHIKITEDELYVIDTDSINLKFVPGFNLHEDSSFDSLSGASFTYTSSDPRIATVE